MLKFNSTPLTGDYVHYYSKDPAFDTESEAFNYDAWKDTGDEKFIPCKPGEKPTKFVLRRLDPDALAFISDRSMEEGGGPVQASIWAVRLAIKNVEHTDVGVPEWELVNKYGHDVMSDVWTRIIQRIEDGDVYGELVGVVMEDMTGSPRD